MGKKYKNPPIIEAVCDFRFTPGLPWNGIFPGLIYREVEAEFSDTEIQRHVSAEMKPNGSSVHQRLETIEWQQFWRKDRSAIIQVAPDLLAVNHLKPYPTWHEFLPIITKALGAFTNIVKPSKIQRLELRYHNHIEINRGNVDLDDYLNFTPRIGTALPQNYFAFFVGIKSLSPNNKNQLKIELTSAEPKSEGALAANLTLAYTLISQDGLDLGNVSEWLGDAHTAIDDAFEACLKDPLRQIFDEE